MGTAAFITFSVGADQEYTKGLGCNTDGTINDLRWLGHEINKWIDDVVFFDCDSPQHVRMLCDHLIAISNNWLFMTTRSKGPFWSYELDYNLENHIFSIKEA